VHWCGYAVADVFSSLSQDCGGFSIWDLESRLSSGRGEATTAAVAMLCHSCHMNIPLMSLSTTHTTPPPPPLHASTLPTLPAPLPLLPSSEGLVTSKGRVASELASAADELVLAELLLGGAASALAPHQLVALMSTFVWQERSDGSQKCGLCTHAARHACQ
jgi:DSHCT (NUC185) domain